jgi:hypothetical protein
MAVSPAGDELEEEAEALAEVATALSGHPPRTVPCRPGSAPVHIQRALASQARTLPPYPGQPTCHVAVWYWAAQEAYARGISTRKQGLVTLGNIAGLKSAGQDQMLALATSGAWKVQGPNPTLPFPGTVLLWRGGSTHVAVATADGITGYNQECILAPYISDRGFTTGGPLQLKAECRTCYTILEMTVVNEAARLNL